MAGLKILITSFKCDTRTGVEVYVRDLALELQRRGHTPILYSPQLGELARELRRMTIPVVDDLNHIASPPDIIHGHHHFETMTALLHFPGVPAIYFCHDWYNWLDSPPPFPRLKRYVAVDQTCYEKLVFEHAVPEERVQLLLNFVDLERFKPRATPLPAQPRRALLYSSYTTDDEYLAAVREACARTGLQLDVMGLGVGSATTEPEKLLGQYDIVFAKARSALEALAVGTAVIIYCMKSVGPLVTAAEIERLLPLNFGVRAMRHLSAPEMLTQELVKEIGRYDARDAAEVSNRVRALSHIERAVDEIVSLYEEVLTEHNSAGASDAVAEGRAAAAYIRWLSSQFKKQLSVLNNLSVMRLKRRLVDVPVVGKLAHSLAQRLAGSSS